MNTSDIYRVCARRRFPNYYSLGPNIAFLANHSVRGVFEEGSGVTSGDGPELEELKDYVMANMMWDPSRDPEHLITEFLNGYYSPAAAPFIRQYMDTMHQAYVQEYAKDNTVHVQACCFAPPGGTHQPYLTADALLKGAAAFNGALNALQHSGGANTTKYRDRVLRATLSVKYTALWRWAELQSYAANASIPWPFVTTSREQEFDYDFSVIYNRTGVERLGDAQWPTHHRHRRLPLPCRSTTPPAAAPPSRIVCRLATPRRMGTSCWRRSMGRTRSSAATWRTGCSRGWARRARAVTLGPMPSHSSRQWCRERWELTLSR
jgi:hypothetical protein